MGKQKYKVINPIGKPGSPEHKIGETIELDDKEAERYLRARAIEPKKAAAPAEPPAGGDDEFNPADVADDDLKDLRRGELEEVAKLEGVEKIGDKNMTELLEEILEIRQGDGE